MMTKQLPESAPRDGTQILADFGWPWLQVASWCHVSQKWAVAEMGCSPCGKDVWFETEYEETYAMKSWVTLPKSSDLQ